MQCLLIFFLPLPAVCIRKVCSIIFKGMVKTDTYFPFQYHLEYTALTLKCGHCILSSKSRGGSCGSPFCTRLWASNRNRQKIRSRMVVLTSEKSAGTSCGTSWRSLEKLFLNLLIVQSCAMLKPKESMLCFKYTATICTTLHIVGVLYKM